MGAVDHEVCCRSVRLGIDLLDRLRERLTGREAAVGLDREGHRDRQPGPVAARTIPIASSTYVIVSVIMSASVPAITPACQAWYSSASSADIRLAGS